MLPSEFCVPITTTFAPCAILDADTVCGSVTAVEDEKNTTSELPFASWSVIFEPFTEATWPATNPPPFRDANAARAEDDAFANLPLLAAPVAPPAMLFPQKMPPTRATTTATAQTPCTLYFPMFFIF